MANVTEKTGLNYNLDSTEPDYLTKLNENTLKIDAYLPLCVIAQIDLADLPVSPADGDFYIVDSSLIYIRQDGIWYTFPLICNMTFYDEELQAFYAYDGTNIILDSGPGGVADAANVGGGLEIFRDFIAGVLNFRTMVAGSGMTITEVGDTLEFESNSGSFPAGTKLIFPQAAAPLGWTLDASENNRFLRIVDDVGGGVGGSFSNLSHTHTVAGHTHNLSSDGWARITGEATDDEMPMQTTTATSWASTRYADVNVITNPGTTSPHVTGVPLDGATDSRSLTTNSSSISHGSGQHAYLDAIICTKD